MNKIQVFKNKEFGQLRTVVIDGTPWMIGKDVAIALGYKDSKSAIADHVDSEDKQIIQRWQNAPFEIPNRGLTLINESGLYSLILSSKLPGAKRFKRWVTSEVLPAIHRTGEYRVKPKASAMTGTSSTMVVSASAPTIAAQSTLLCPGRVKTLRRCERMLKLWNISHMFIVRNAIVMPWGETPCGISKYPTSMQWPMI